MKACTRGAEQLHDHEPPALRHGRPDRHVYSLFCMPLKEAAHVKRAASLGCGPYSVWLYNISGSDEQAADVGQVLRGLIGAARPLGRRRGSPGLLDKARMNLGRQVSATQRLLGKD